MFHLTVLRSPRSLGAREARPGRRGITLAEVVVSTLLVGILMVAALSSVGAAARSWIAASEASDGHALARQLLDEITSQGYEDAVSPVFGPEAGETLAVGVRSGLDDVDDYLNWSDSPPKDRSGVAIPGFGGWTRLADVVKLKSDSREVLPDNATDQGLRLVTVTVTSPTGNSVTLSSFRSDVGGGLQAQGTSQTLVTWAGVSLQAGASAPVSSGVSLLNHATDQ